MEDQHQILYQKKNGNMIPDFIVPGDENSIGFIADAKYLPPQTEIREKDLKKMEKYAKSGYYKKLTESGQRGNPTAFSFVLVIVDLVMMRKV